MRKSCGVLISALGWWAAAAALPTSAEWRDPTELPPALRQVPSAQGTGAGTGAGTNAAANINIQHLVMVDGHYFVVVGGRRLRAGDKLGAARIARIEESAVWLTEAGVTRKQDLYVGVEKHAELAPASPDTQANPAKRVKPAPSDLTPRHNRTAQSSKEE